jgi:hypothetical protein
MVLQIKMAQASRAYRPICKAGSGEFPLPAADSVLIMDAEPRVVSE